MTPCAARYVTTAATHSPTDCVAVFKVNSGSVGGSYGEHDAHVTCGPDVRVRTANGGLVYHHMVPLTEAADHGLAVDVRGGIGQVAIKHIYPSSDPGAAPRPAAAEPRIVGSSQVLLGYDWLPFGFAIGGGYFGDPEGAYAPGGTRYRFLPAVAFRFGTRNGKFTGSAGIGAPPVPAVARLWGLYADFGVRTDSGIVIGGGMYAPLYGDLEQTTGLYTRGGFPVAPRVRLDVLGGLEIAAGGEASAQNNLGYRVGVGATFALGQTP